MFFYLAYIQENKETDDVKIDPFGLNKGKIKDK
jgi:hypothetical protein